MATRRGSKWHPPPPPAPKILHLPRRARRPVRTAPAAPHVRKVAPAAPPTAEPMLCGRLDALFEQERSFTAERRARVVEEMPTSSSSASASPSPSPPVAARRGVSSRESGRGESEEEEKKWRFQAEILRAECNFLRMEREVALKKLERNRQKVEAALRSAVDAVVSGRKKVEGNLKAGVVLQEVQGKLEDLQRRRGRGRRRKGIDSLEAALGWRSGGRNFDKKALLLRRRLQEMNVREMMPKSVERVQKECARGDDDEEEICVREIREIAADTTGTSFTEKKQDSDLPPDSNRSLPEVEMLRRKMEGICRGMLERVEEYGSILSSTSCSSSSALCFSSGKGGGATCRTARNDNPKLEKDARRELQTRQEGGEGEDGDRCSGQCKEVVRRLVEQVRAETEQWGEMQGMLDQVKEEMEDLRCSRDFWERCAVQSDQKLRSINAEMMEWRQKTRGAEQRVAELQKQATALQHEVVEGLSLLRPPGCNSSYAAIKSRARTSSAGFDGTRTRREQQQQRIAASSPCDMHKEKEKEKRVLFCRFLDKNTAPAAPAHVPIRRRAPLREIGNL